MVKSTLTSVGIHVFLIMFVYYGLPSFEVKEPIELPIDFVEDTPISSKTSLKLGETRIKQVKKIQKVIKKEKIKCIIVYLIKIITKKTELWAK